MAKGKGGFIGQDGLNAPDPATGVSATAGDGQVTVSFTAPSDVGGAAITGYNVVGSDGSNASPYFSGTTYSSKSFTPSPTINSLGVAFKTDGTKMYTLDITGDDVAQYSLTSAWDVSTATSDSKSFDVGSQDTDPYEVAFKSDGTKMYILGTANDTLYQYSISTAWDVSTASYDSVSFSFTSQTLQPYGMSFSPDGTKLYVADQQNSKILQYALSTAWDASTISYASKFLDVSGEQGNSIYGVAISYDGSYIYSGTQTTGVVYQYKLSTAFDVSTGSYTGASVSTASQEAAPTSIEFDTSGKSMFITGFNTDTIYQYTVPDYPTASPVTVTDLTNGTSYTFNVWAINPFGWSSPSDASGSVSPAAPVGLFAGGDSSTNTIEYITLGSAGNATDFGDLDGSYSYGEQSDGGMGSGTRSIFVTGTNATQYVNPYSTGNAQLFGTLSTGRFATSACSNSIRGLIFTGDNYSAKLNVIDYVTIATTGNATDFGDDTLSRAATSSCANSLYATNNAGYNSSSTTYNQQSRVTIASTGNATSFGSLVNTPELFSASCSNSTYGITSGGYDPWSGSYWNNTERFTFTSSGSSVDWGNLTQQRYGHASTSNETTCFVAGGNAGSGSTSTNSIETRLFSSNGGWSDFGDLTVSRKYVMSTSTAHGGLS